MGGDKREYCSYVRAVGFMARSRLGWRGFAERVLRYASCYDVPREYEGLVVLPNFRGGAIEYGRISLYFRDLDHIMMLQ